MSCFKDLKNLVYSNIVNVVHKFGTTDLLFIDKDIANK